MSRTTGLVVRPEGERLRLVDAVTGEALRWPEEVEAACMIAEERAVEEAAARRAEAARAAAAEERLRALELELDRLRKA